jgi:hypothetical protein
MWDCQEAYRNKNLSLNQPPHVDSSLQLLKEYFGGLTVKCHSFKKNALLN